MTMLEYAPTTNKKMAIRFHLAYRHGDQDFNVLGIYEDYMRAVYALKKLQSDFPTTHFQLLGGSMSRH